MFIERQHPVTRLFARLPHVPWLALGFVLIGVALLLGTTPDNAAATRTPITGLGSLPPASPDVLGQITLPLALPAVSAPAHSDPAHSDPLGSHHEWHEVTVDKGDTLGSIFSRIGVDPKELQAVLTLGAESEELARIHPGEGFRIRVNRQGLVEELVYDTDETHILQIVRQGEGFRASIKERALERRLTQGAGFIWSSLFGAAQEAGLSDNLTMKLAAIFGYDIDFALDIWRGDRFHVVYEEYYADGIKVRDGEILAAEFTNRDNTYRALRHTDPLGQFDYYAPDGRSLQKAFLRTPVEFSRISSYFSLARRHPVLNRIRAHKGVDYAAPTGTAVKATSDGLVDFVGRKGGYGKAVVLQHGKHYSTLYGHLSGFARGLRSGTRIKQGQIIGYVGMTGLATGPHLHYEFRVDGIHKDPLSIKFLQKEPLSGRELLAFQTETRPLLAKLDLLRHIMVALHQR